MAQLPSWIFHSDPWSWWSAVKSYQKSLISRGETVWCKLVVSFSSHLYHSNIILKSHWLSPGKVVTVSSFSWYMFWEIESCKLLVWLLYQRMPSVGIKRLCRICTFSSSIASNFFFFFFLQELITEGGYSCLSFFLSLYIASILNGHTGTTVPHFNATQSYFCSCLSWFLFLLPSKGSHNVQI